VFRRSVGSAQCCTAGTRGTPSCKLRVQRVKLVVFHTFGDGFLMAPRCASVLPHRNTWKASCSTVQHQGAARCSTQVQLGAAARCSSVPSVQKHGALRAEARCTRCSITVQKHGALGAAARCSPVNTWFLIISRNGCSGGFRVHTSLKEGNLATTIIGGEGVVKGGRVRPVLHGSRA
jgi:hypothetical protein